MERIALVAQAACLSHQLQNDHVSETENVPSIICSVCSQSHKGSVLEYNHIATNFSLVQREVLVLSFYFARM